MQTAITGLHMHSENSITIAVTMVTFQWYWCRDGSYDAQ